MALFTRLSFVLPFLFYRPFPPQFYSSPLHIESRILEQEMEMGWKRGEAEERGWMRGRREDCVIG